MNRYKTVQVKNFQGFWQNRQVLIESPCLQVSKNNIALGKEVYEFCDLFSHSSEDLADAAEIFLKNLHGLYPESKLNGRGVDSDNSAVNS